jgi:hypothetical protein
VELVWMVTRENCGIPIRFGSFNSASQHVVQSGSGQGRSRCRG